MCYRSRNTGSSPRAWGTPVRRDAGDPEYRFIPTCMGNSSGGGYTRRSRPVHPHVHGELGRRPPAPTGYRGSSPRAWGTRGNCGSGGLIPRFIPTCMGNSGGGAAPAPGQTGSSPRAWGTQLNANYERMAARFIPTCMGNSHNVDQRRLFPPVHPHVHGELAGHGHRACSGRGSSPRAWGTRKAAYHRIYRRRFIPTCMGNSGYLIFVRPEVTVHPHVHGELTKERDESAKWTGSSPRAWGTPVSGNNHEPDRRFIPTCMGNSPPARAASSRSTVHPHVHGELSCSPAAGGSGIVHPHVHGELSGPTTVLEVEYGSSPRAWGTRDQRVPGSRRGRFIPTCMGNSPSGDTDRQPTPVHPHVHGELAPA